MTMGKYLDLLQAAEQNTCDISDISDKTSTRPFSRFCRFCRPFAELEERRPDYVDTVSWQAAVEDARRFLTTWGAQAERLGWTDKDLFGLHEPPAQPAATYRRLSRHDCAGLLWCLNGRPVIALTDQAATIAATAGSRLTWRRRPGLRA
jgi:hypothetical protein